MRFAAFTLLLLPTSACLVLGIDLDRDEVGSGSSGGSSGGSGGVGAAGPGGGGEGGEGGTCVACSSHPQVEGRCEPGCESPEGCSPGFFPDNCTSDLGCCAQTCNSEPYTLLISNVGKPLMAAPTRCGRLRVGLAGGTEIRNLSTEQASTLPLSGDTSFSLIDISASGSFELLDSSVNYGGKVMELLAEGEDSLFCGSVSAAQLVDATSCDVENISGGPAGFIAIDTPETCDLTVVTPIESAVRGLVPRDGETIWVGVDVSPGSDVEDPLPVGNAAIGRMSNGQAFLQVELTGPDEASVALDDIDAASDSGAVMIAGATDAVAGINYIPSVGPGIILPVDNPGGGPVRFVAMGASGSSSADGFLVLDGEPLTRARLLALSANRGLMWSDYRDLTECGGATKGLLTSHLAVLELVGNDIQCTPILSVAAPDTLPISIRDVARLDDGGLLVVGRCTDEQSLAGYPISCGEEESVFVARINPQLTSVETVEVVSLGAEAIDDVRVARPGLADEYVLSVTFKGNASVSVGGRVEQVGFSGQKSGLVLKRLLPGEDG